MSAKVIKNIGFLKRIKVKYIISVAILAIAAQVVLGAAFSEVRYTAALHTIATAIGDTLKPTAELGEKVEVEKVTPTTQAEVEKITPSTQAAARQRRRSSVAPTVDPSTLNLPDSATRARRDSLRAAGNTIEVFGNDSTGAKKGGSFLEDVISGKNTDSLVYDVKNKLVYIYNEGDVTYQNMNLKADFMRVNMETKEIYAYGKPDSVDGKLVPTHPVFTEGQASYTMDTITYNISSKKAKIKSNISVVKTFKNGDVI